MGDRKMNDFPDIPEEEDTLYLISINPVACPRPRVTNKGFVYYPQGYTKFKKELEFKIRELEIEPYPKETPLILRARFFMPIPKSKKYIGFHYKKPDLDNLIKSLCDGLESSEVVYNDSCFVQLDCVKQYSPNPKIMFQIQIAEFE